MTTNAVLIDGDAARLEQTAQAFTAAGFAVTRCARAEDAMAAVKDAPSALVVLSDDLPGGAATGVLAALRKDKATRDSTYLVLTSGVPRDVADAMAEHGGRAHDFAPRQISNADLITRATRLLASQGIATGGPGGFAIGVTGNPEGAAKAVMVAASEPIAPTGTASPKIPGHAGGASHSSANTGERVAISYSAGGDKAAAKPGLAHGSTPVENPAAPGRSAAQAKIAALIARAAAADDVAGKLSALEQVLAIAYDELEDVTTAVLTAEKIVEFDPGHVVAVTFLREVYKQLGAKDKLAAVEAGFRRAVTGG